MDGEGAKPIVLHAVPDQIPEFNEFYVLKLVNISGAVFASFTLLPAVFIYAVLIRILWELMIKNATSWSGF